MPIYEYRRADGTTFEVMQSMAEDAWTKDPETGQAVERVLHAPAVHFKGSGFYNTDYGTKRRSREREAEKASSASSSSASSDGAGKKDAKAKEPAGEAKKEKTPSPAASSAKK